MRYDSLAERAAQTSRMCQQYSGDFHVEAHPFDSVSHGGLPGRCNDWHAVYALAILHKRIIIQLSQRRRVAAVKSAQVA